MPKEKEKNSLKTQAVVMILLLVVQYLLGMATNLFVQFPESKSSAKLWEFAWSQFPLSAHIILGFLLLAGAIVFVIRSALAKNKTWIIVSVIGLLSIFTAGFAGATFIPTQSGIYSYFMALSFIVALLSYSWGIYSSKV